MNIYNFSHLLRPGASLTFVVKDWEKCHRIRCAAQMWARRNGVKVQTTWDRPAGRLTVRRP